MTKADASKLGYVGAKPGERKSNEWYTPHDYVKRVIHGLGGVDLDPMSSAEANRIVAAPKYWTEQDDALTMDWSKAKAKTVFMNPPYSAKMITPSVDKFVSEYLSGSFQRGIVLVNNATETKWFHKLLASADAVCFTDHRIAFWNADGKAMSGNTRGQAFFYFDKRHSKAGYNRFSRQFSEIGLVVRGGING